MSSGFLYPEGGLVLSQARVAIDAMRGKRFVNRKTGIVAQLSSSAKGKSKQHGHHIYSVEAIKVEALDRIVEVVSGNTPHASSASTHNIVSSYRNLVKWGSLGLLLFGSVALAVGLGNIVCNIHEWNEAIKYREISWGVVNLAIGSILIIISNKLDKWGKHEK